MGKSLAQQANEEFDSACRERESHEMRNEDASSQAGNQGLESDSRSHKPIARGSQHRR